MSLLYGKKLRCLHLLFQHTLTWAICTTVVSLVCFLDFLFSKDQLRRTSLVSQLKTLQDLPQYSWHSTQGSILEIFENRNLHLRGTVSASLLAYPILVPHLPSLRSYCLPSDVSDLIHVLDLSYIVPSCTSVPHPQTGMPASCLQGPFPLLATCQFVKLI